MSGWSAMAGTHGFVLPDEDRARDAAQALVDHGFPVVTARPRPYDDWVVTAYDEGPYPVDALGYRMVGAVGRQAGAIVARYGGYAGDWTRCAAGELDDPADIIAPVKLVNPGARPPVPEVTLVKAPPSFTLSMEPDDFDDIVVDLPGLDEVPWQELTDAHGTAEEIPLMLRELADPDGDWSEVLSELFGDYLLHQGTCHPATVRALPFLTALIESGGLPAWQRLDLYRWLVIVAQRRLSEWMRDAWQAAAEGWPPEVDELTERVHATVGDQVPRLLARWDREPPAVRFVLACLAGLYPEHGHGIAVRIAEMAEEFHGTQQGAYLCLAAALAQGGGVLAMTMAGTIVSWEGEHDPGWLDAPGLSVEARAGYVLAQGVPLAISNVD